MPSEPSVRTETSESGGRTSLLRRSLGAAIGFALTVIAVATVSGALLGRGWPGVMALSTAIGLLLIAPALLARWLNDTPGADVRMSYVGVIATWTLLITVAMSYQSPGAVARGIETGASVVARGAEPVPSLRTGIESAGALAARLTRSVEIFVFGAPDEALAPLVPPAAEPPIERQPVVEAGGAADAAAPSTSSAPGDASAGETLGSPLGPVSGAGRAETAATPVSGGAAVVVVVNRRYALHMIVDPGATTTLVERRALARLGVPEPAAEVAAAATNPAELPVVLLPTLALAGIELDPVAVRACEGCGGGEADGRLGLNVLESFDWALSDDGSVLMVEDRRPAVDDRLDVALFLDLVAQPTESPTSWVVSAVNRAPIGVELLLARLVLLDEAGVEVASSPLRMPRAGPGQQLRGVVEVEADAAYESWRVELRQALWNRSEPRR